MSPIQEKAGVHGATDVHGRRRQLGGDPDWWRGGVIYQIYPRSFKDTNGDGVGDLAGIAAQLDYIADLGADAIWISPFFVSPMDDFGYDVADYCGVDPMFGTLDDFDAVVQGAHERGVRVIIDMVLSHTSNQHVWFKESRANRENPKANWYVWADPKPDGSPPTNWLSIFGGSAWEWNARRRQYFLHNFLTSQPDLNFHNPEVQDAVLDACRFWLDRGVDGFRLDTANMYVHDAELRDNPPLEAGMEVNGIPPENPYAMQQPIYNINRPECLKFHERLRQLMNKYPATACVGEVGAVLDMYEALAAYTEGGKRLHMAYSFDFLNEIYGAKHVRRVAETMNQKAGTGWPSWAFSNHDVPRVVSRWGLEDDADAAAPLLVALQASLRGTPCIYQGEELGLPEADVPFERLQDPYGIRFWPEFKGRDGCRTPMPWSSGPNGGFTSGEPWLPVPEAHLRRAVSAQEGEPDSTLNRVRRFLKWRRSQPSLSKGAARFFDAPEDVVLFARESAGERTICAFNMGRAAVEVDLSAVGSVTPLDGHGFRGRFLGKRVALDRFDAFFGAL